MTPDLAEALTRSLSCGIWPLEGRVSVYVSWSDESSSNSGSGQFLVSGLVADEKCWPNFSRRWVEEVLQNPPIEYLHMVEIRSKAWRAERNVTQEQAKEKVRTAIRIICEEAPVKIYMGSLPEGVFAASTKRLVKAGGELPRHQGNPDYPAFTAYALAVLEQTSSNIPGLERVRFNISNKKHVSHHIRNGVRDALIQHYRDQGSPIASMIGDILPLCMEDNMPLQAADVVCWHLQRAYAKREDTEDSYNAKQLDKKGICGFDLSPHLQEFEDGMMIQIGLGKEHAKRAEIYSETMARLSGFSKQEIMEAVAKEDPNLRIIRKSQFDKFDSTMRKLIKVPHDEIKAKLDEEKKSKKRKKP